jgi:hypothetical protein
MPTPYTITHESVSVVIDGKMYTVKRGDPNYEAAKDAVLSERWEDVPGLLSKGFALEEWVRRFAEENEDFGFRDGLIFFDGEGLPHQLHERMLMMSENGDDPRSLMRFWARLQENPSGRSVEQLFPFLAHHNIPIDQDGYILAYKSVRRDYKDHHSGRFDNSVGRVHKMKRNRISDDPRAACAEGFHVGALAYARGFGGGNSRLLICRVDPADVVSIPYDSHQQKMRVCRYKVIAHYGEPLPSTTIDTSKDEAMKETTRDMKDSVESFAKRLGAGTRTSANAGQAELGGFKPPGAPGGDGSVIEVSDTGDAVPQDEPAARLGPPQVRFAGPRHRRSLEAPQGSHQR